MKILQNAGHFPVETPGIQQLESECINFIENGIQSVQPMIAAVAIKHDIPLLHNDKDG